MTTTTQQPEAPDTVLRRERKFSSLASLASGVFPSCFTIFLIRTRGDGECKINVTHSADHKIPPQFRHFPLVAAVV